MEIAKAEFIKSAAGKEGFYSSGLYQFAVAGRSNVGKSSFINMLANRKKLAKTSSTPGRTRLVNYFDFGSFVLTDLPGYGYASVTHSEKEKWGALIDSYLTSEPSLLRVLMLVDIRHEPSQLDKQLAAYLYANRIPFNIIATKADKISRGALAKQKSVLAAALRVGAGDITVTSAQTCYGKEDVLSLIELVLNAKQHEEKEQLDLNE